jgi:hypothetical protein
MDKEMNFERFNGRRDMGLSQSAFQMPKLLKSISPIKKSITIKKRIRMNFVGS